MMQRIEQLKANGLTAAVIAAQLNTDGYVPAIRVLQTFATTLAGYRSGLLAWYDHPISTGPLEGTNNKIKTMKRQAYGYRDQACFALKILALHYSR